MSTPSNGNKPRHIDTIRWESFKKDYPACLNTPQFPLPGTLDSEESKYPGKEFKYFQILHATIEQQGTWAATKGVLLQERVLTHDNGPGSTVIFRYQTPNKETTQDKRRTKPAKNGSR